MIFGKILFLLFYISVLYIITGCLAFITWDFIAWFKEILEDLFL